MKKGDLLDDYRTNDGMNVVELSYERPILLIFLRHFGCIFCREALKEIAARIDDWEQSGIKVILVHMADDDTAEEYFKDYHLNSVTHISDPTTELYGSFGLAKGNASQLFGLKNVMRGFEVSIGRGIPVSMRQIGDGFQMPGIFLIRDNEIINSYIHKNASDRPNYDDIIELKSRESTS